MECGNVWTAFFIGMGIAFSISSLIVWCLYFKIKKLIKNGIQK
jgi:hypothetical protein